MLVRGLLVACALVLATVAAIMRGGAPPASESSQQQRTPWSLRSANAGIIFTWSRSAPELRGAAKIDLIVYDGVNPTRQSLDDDTGTLVMPFHPEALVVEVDGRRMLLYGSEPRPIAETRPAIEPQVNTVQAKSLPERRLKLPMVLSNRGRTVVSSADVALPRVPTYVSRPIEIELSVKVTPQGSVAAVSSNYRTDPLRRRLSGVASDAISHWQFNRIAEISYREGRVRFVFMRKRVSVQAAPAHERQRRSRSAQIGLPRINRAAGPSAAPVVAPTRRRVSPPGHRTVANPIEDMQVSGPETVRRNATRKKR